METVTGEAGVRVEGEPVALRDGRHVTVRAIAAGDAAGLVEFHGRLSERSRYLRFHTLKPRLRSWEADYLAGVNFATRLALVATVTEDGEERIVADARLDTLGPGRAEVGIVVRDDLQGTGLGRELLQRLVALAPRLGADRLVFAVLPENAGMLALARSLGAAHLAWDGRAEILEARLPIAAAAAV